MPVLPPVLLEPDVEPVDPVLPAPVELAALLALVLPVELVEPELLVALVEPELEEVALLEDEVAALLPDCVPDEPLEEAELADVLLAPVDAVVEAAPVVVPELEEPVLAPEQALAASTSRARVVERNLPPR